MKWTTFWVSQIKDVDYRWVDSLTIYRVTMTKICNDQTLGTSSASRCARLEWRFQVWHKLTVKLVRSYLQIWMSIIIREWSGNSKKSYTNLGLWIIFGGCRWDRGLNPSNPYNKKVLPWFLYIATVLEKVRREKGKDEGSKIQTREGYSNFEFVCKT